ncbi:hypothetical protein ONZ45_g18453 [Pleurotus djamor]|nr:hypothetical protein ONZ45_g18453 [Pleurotus djamor]
MAPNSKRVLPAKETGLFRELLNLYESRQLKKGVKTADQILKKFPEHGETLCMKGLCLAQTGKRDEGIELVKKGMRCDLTSHICWHVFGLLQRDEKNYEEALKSYTQALRFDKNVPDYDVEQSETLLYHVRVIEEMGNYAEALHMLDINSKSRAIVDRTAVMEFRARLMSKSKDPGAKNAWRSLIEHNADCYEYYYGYLQSMDIDLDNLTDETRGAALSAMNEFSAQLPRAASPRRIALTIATGRPPLRHCAFVHLLKDPLTWFKRAPWIP